MERSRRSREEESSLLLNLSSPRRSIEKHHRKLNLAQNMSVNSDLNDTTPLLFGKLHSTRSFK